MLKEVPQDLETIEVLEQKLTLMLQSNGVKTLNKAIIEQEIFTNNQELLRMKQKLEKLKADSPVKEAPPPEVIPPDPEKPKIQ